MTLGAIAEVTGGRVVPASAADVQVDGPVVTDDREMAPGGLYVARVGERADGHAYLPRAVEAGAVAGLTTREVEGVPCVVVDDTQEAFAALASAVVRSVPGLVVVGVTGSSGKTTTKDLLAAVLAGHGETVANVGSLNSEVGVPLTVCRVTPSTRCLVLEMGARGVGHIRYLTDMTHPSIGVVLNVGSAHVGEFGSREAIGRAKSELVQALPPGGLAVLNADDPIVTAMEPAPGAEVVRVGTAVDADVRAVDVEIGDDGAPSYVLVAGDERAPVRLRLVGEHQVANSLAVAAVALRLGMTLPDIAAALGQARPGSRWRMEVVERADGVTVVNDAYNANPESTASALRTLARLGARRRSVAVLGEMLELGAGSAAEHEAVGELAGRLGIDLVVAVGAGAAPVARGAEHAGAGEVVVVDDTEAAFALLGRELREGDVVLLKSSRDSGLRLLGERLVAREEVAS